jgi:hypothetical protein
VGEELADDRESGNVGCMMADLLSMGCLRKVSLSSGLNQPATMRVVFWVWISLASNAGA